MGATPCAARGGDGAKTKGGGNGERGPRQRPPERGSQSSRAQARRRSTFPTSILWSADTCAGFRHDHLGGRFKFGADRTLNASTNLEPAGQALSTLHRW